MQSSDFIFHSCMLQNTHFIFINEVKDISNVLLGEKDLRLGGG